MISTKNLNIALIAAALAVPGISFANTQYHLVDGEVGYKEFPEHVQPSGLTRAEVLKEVQQSRADGSMAAMSRGNGMQNLKDQAKGNASTGEHAHAHAAGQHNSNATTLNGKK